VGGEEVGVELDGEGKERFSVVQPLKKNINLHSPLPRPLSFFSILPPFSLLLLLLPSSSLSILPLSTFSPSSLQRTVTGAPERYPEGKEEATGRMHLPFSTNFPGPETRGKKEYPKGVFVTPTRIISHGKKIYAKNSNFFKIVEIPGRKI
jgi:hypothetical protein